MIFINFDAGAEPLAAKIPDLIELISPWDIGAMEPVHRSEIEGDYNWKVMLENANENYHTIAVHRDSFHAISPAEHSYSSDGQRRNWHDLYTPIPGRSRWSRGRGSRACPNGRASGCPSSRSTRNS
ncbi:SRPBCC family protein [Rhizorhabdus histidinilytica]